MIIEKPEMAIVGKVLTVSPIEGADLIQQTEVVCGKAGKWTGVTTKEIKQDDIVVVFLPDAIVPQIEPLMFMERRHWRVKPCRLRGCPSEVLIVPLKNFRLPKAVEISEYLEQILPVAKVGMDVTKWLGIKKFEKEVPAQMKGESLGNFPSFIPKTDEVNFQQVPKFREALEGKMCYVSTKIDGSSLTIYHANGHFGACSRNWEKKEDYNNALCLWKIVKKYNLKENLPRYGNYAIQAEICGPGIQKNPLKLIEVDAVVFDVFSIDIQEYVDMPEARQVAKECGMKFVDYYNIVFKNKELSDEALRKMAEGVYKGTDNQREGIVLRPIKTLRVDGQRVSFKILNLKYKGI